MVHSPNIGLWHQFCFDNMFNVGSIFQSKLFGLFIVCRSRFWRVSSSIYINVFSLNVPLARKSPKSTESKSKPFLNLFFLSEAPIWPPEIAAQSENYIHFQF